MIFSIKRGSSSRRTVSFLLLSQLLTKLLLVLTMKFAFALLPIAAVLGFVQAGPVLDESLVRASIFPRNIYRAHY